MNQRSSHHHSPLRNRIEIFSGALWGQRHHWRRVAPLLPANACLLVIDPQNEHLTPVMRSLARSFRDQGRPVLIWMTPKNSPL